MKSKRVVITGGPGTGKTVVIKELEQRGYPCFHEIIRDMTSKAKEDTATESLVSNPLVFVADALKFNKDLLYGRAKHYQISLEMQHPLIFFDRGIPDVLGYMDFFEQPYDEEFIMTCKNHRYDHVFLLPPWKEIYVSDNERLESFEEAEQIHLALENTYIHFGYDPIIVPKSPIADRVNFILEKLKSQ